MTARRLQRPEGHPSLWGRLLLRSAAGAFTAALAKTVRTSLLGILPGGIPEGFGLDVTPTYDDLLRRLAQRFRAGGCESSAVEVEQLATLGWVQIGVPDAESQPPLGDLLEQAAKELASVPAVAVVQRGVDVVPLSRIAESGCVVRPCIQAGVELAAAVPAGIGAGQVSTKAVNGDPRVVDVEAGWAFVHTCVKRFKCKLIHGVSSGSQAFHGTGVLSLLAAGGAGCQEFGLAPGVDVLLSSTQPAAHAPEDEVSAIAAALLELEAGDVLVLELQESARLLPAEFCLPVFHLVHAATTCGIVVIEAAGNGKRDLNGEEWPVGAATPESWRDSGAILVGGVANPAKNGTYTRWKCSNFGDRVKVFGWAQGVLVAGLIDNNHQCFDGTSAATAIVAGCAVVMQRLALAQEKPKRLSPPEIREKLERLGTPVKDGGKSLGVVPDLEAVAAEIAQPSIRAAQRTGRKARRRPAR